MAVHANDERASGATAFAHIMGVTSIVVDNGGDEDEAIAALLHDTAEDFGGESRLADIGSRFGDRVARIVRGCSDSLCASKSLRPPWVVRKRAYLIKLPREDESVWKVCAADKLNNARGLFREVGEKGELFWKRIDRSPEDLIAYWSAVHHVLDSMHPTYVTSELGALVGQLKLSYCDPMDFRVALDALLNGNS